MSHIIVTYQGVTRSHDEYRKVVHKPYSNYISSIQEIDEDFIKFFLSTWT